MMAATNVVPSCHCRMNKFLYPNTAKLTNLLESGQIAWFTWTQPDLPDFQVECHAPNSYFGLVSFRHIWGHIWTCKWPILLLLVACSSLWNLLLKRRPTKCCHCLAVRSTSFLRFATEEANLDLKQHEWSHHSHWCRVHNFKQQLPFYESIGIPLSFKLCSVPSQILYQRTVSGASKRKSRAASNVRLSSGYERLDWSIRRWLPALDNACSSDILALDEYADPVITKFRLL